MIRYQLKDHKLSLEWDTGLECKFIEKIIELIIIFNNGCRKNES